MADPKAARSNDLRHNYQRALEVLSWSEGMTRAALAAQLGLPKGTVTGMVENLLERSLIEETGPERQPVRPGRPAKLLKLVGPTPLVAAVVLSGGILRAGLVSYAGTVVGRAATPLEGQAADAGVSEPAAALIREALDRAGDRAGPLRAAVLGVPAPIQPGLGLAPPLRKIAGERRGERQVYLPWLRTDPAAEFGKRLGVPALLENDANLGALGEATFGAGRGVDSLIYLKLVHQVGAGIILGGSLHRGATGFAGELGHVHVRDDGPLCVCGGRGCLNLLLGDALVQAVQPAYDRRITLRDVLELAAAGETGPRRVLDDLGRTIGRPLADFATLFNPAAVIVDGSLAPAVAQVIAGIGEMLERFAAPVASNAITVVAGELGDDADLLGAAALARRSFAQ